MICVSVYIHIVCVLVTMPFAWFPCCGHRHLIIINTPPLLAPSDIDTGPMFGDAALLARVQGEIL